MNHFETIELKVFSKDDGYHEIRVEQPHRYCLAEVMIGKGQERYLALCLHELVARGAIDVALVRRFFEACENGDRPKVGR